ncbi:hypothetical protein RvY_08009 [Ramazzottius varieornatus]|uniref:J domain-containing protein n=1 Tax=Ramazzottius varieornatus TaxID=947166 RepID=A0A1D1V4D9_RAMVA|nr:hypothetical protein RvY_08009 [Ramazzottius varieornatus]
MRLLTGTLLVVFLHIALFALVAARSPYEVLGLSRNADQREIKRAYKKLAREWHPDRSTKKEAQARFVEIADAYQILSDPKRRKNYDQYGENTSQRQQQRHPFSSDGETVYFYQSSDGSRYQFQGDPFAHFSQDFFRARRREPQEPLSRRIWNKVLSFDGLTSWVLTLLTVGAITGVGALVRFFDADEGKKDPRSSQAAFSPSHRTLPTDKLIHEMSLQTYYGLLKLQKPGCRTVLLLVDGSSKGLVDQFADTIHPYRNSRTLAFAYVDLDKYFHWYLHLLREAGLVGPSVDIKKKPCLGTVLVLNNFKRCFFLFHSKATRRLNKKENYYGFSDSSDSGDSDVESQNLTNRKRRQSQNVGFLQTSADSRNSEVSLDGLSTWLERVFDGQGTKLTVDQWPELTKYG